jgi:gliding motility-associated-like protein
MKVFYLFVIAFLALIPRAHADHITGGEMFYTSSGNINGTQQYAFTLKLFMRCNSGRTFNNPTTVSIFDRLTNQRISDVSVALSNQETISLNTNNPCISNPPTVCYVVGYYDFVLNLPESVNGYTVAAQVNFRIAGITNLTGGYSQIGATYTAEIPGTKDAPDGPQNNSAQFVGSDLVVVCGNNSFSYSFGAEDKDGDELRYSFCNAYQSGTSGNGSPPPNPPYEPVPYGNGFDGTSPLGPSVQINPSNGLITGIAPNAGIYVVTVCVDEIRNGVVIATQRKDLQINITNCSIASADLLPEYQLCRDTKTISVNNQSNSPLITSYTWQIDATSGPPLYTSTDPTLTYSFGDTGLYTIHLVINKNQQCSDSASTKVRVYPGFKADFSFSGICINKPTDFIDASHSVYGVVKSWTWQFADVGNGTRSALQNPSYTFQQQGQWPVQLIATDSKGCVDTAVRNVSIVTKPPIVLSARDTLICKGDSLTLHAIGEGNFTWMPHPNIVAVNGPQVVVDPPVTSFYSVLLDDQGCINSDSVLVRVVDHVSLSGLHDTVICAGDPVFLRGVSNGLHFRWTPAALVNDPQSLNTEAQPQNSTLFQLVASIGHCSASGSVTVTTVPFPIARAGADTVICYHSPAQLHGFVNGTTFTWFGAGGDSFSNTLNPVVSPLQTSTFVLQAFDTLGCPKPGRDTVVVTVLPKINPSAGHDTAVVVGQPLQLQATGGTSFTWEPGTNLSAVHASDPIAVFSEPTNGVLYKVLVYNEAGCADSAQIIIKVFSTQPIVFVPNAFTPNHDGKNDVLRPIAAGMQRIVEFAVFNRWGQLIFTTNIEGKGWDGRVNGLDQATGTYTWLVKAVDYKGQSYFQKGVVTLIR